LFVPGLYAQFSFQEQFLTEFSHKEAFFRPAVSRKDFPTTLKS
jgi:hypothetical protein